MTGTGGSLLGRGYNEDDPKMAPGVLRDRGVRQ